MLSLQNQSVQRAQKSIRYAQSLLLKTDLNDQNASISYLRLCCAAIANLRSVGIDLAPQLDKKRPYLTLLKGFYRHDPRWVESCMVASGGVLLSSDIWIDRHLEILRCASVRILSVRILLEHGGQAEPELETQMSRTA